MAARYRVTLTKDEVTTLGELSHKGACPARQVLYARALLLMDKGGHGKNQWTVEQTAQAMGLTPRTLEHLKARFVEHGLEAALERKKPCRPSRAIVFDGDFAARVTHLACSAPPEGRARWTVRLLAEQLVALEIVESVSAMTVCNTLKKTNFSLTAANTGKSRRTKTPRS